MTNGVLPLLRAASAADLTSLVALDALVNHSPWSTKQYSDALIEKDGTERIIVATFASVLVGFVVTAVVFEEASIYKMVVQPSHQRQGIGRLLMSHALADAQSNGARQCFLEVRASNSPAIKLYRNMGFQVDGRRSDYYLTDFGREDAILMSMQLVCRCT
ncbi:MAG: ribosomal protein S18-alanine N-acetyltransferase [Pseudomonadota bacterium]